MLSPPMYFQLYTLSTMSELTDRLRDLYNATGAPSYMLARERILELEELRVDWLAQRIHYEKDVAFLKNVLQDYGATMDIVNEQL